MLNQVALARRSVRGLRDPAVDDVVLGSVGICIDPADEAFARSPDVPGEGQLGARKRAAIGALGDARLAHALDLSAAGAGVTLAASGSGPNSVNQSDPFARPPGGSWTV